MANRRDWDSIFGVAAGLSKSLLSSRDLGLTAATDSMRALRTFDMGVGRFSTLAESTRAVRSLEKSFSGLGALAESTRTLRALDKSLVGLSALRAATDGATILRALDKGLTGLSSLSAATESAKALRGLDKSLSGLGALFAKHEGSTALRSLSKTVGAFDDVTGSSTRTLRAFDKGLSGLNSFPSTTESAKTLRALEKSFSGLSALNAATQSASALMSKSLDGLSAFASVAEISRASNALGLRMGGASAFFAEIDKPRVSRLSSQFIGLGKLRAATEGAGILKDLEKSLGGLSELGLGDLVAKAAVVGLLGKFDEKLTRDAVAAAALVEYSDGDLDALDGAREQSALVDAIADVEAFSVAVKDATPDELRQRQDALVEALFSKYEQHRNTANTQQARISLDRVLNYLMMLVALVALVYTRQQVLLAEESTKSGSEDASALRSAISETSNDQVEELRRVREVLERYVEDDGQSHQDDLEYYIVARPAMLVARPAIKAPVVASLYPNQAVVLVQRRHKWIKIKYYDYLSGSLVEGWVMKKYLHRVVE